MRRNEEKPLVWLTFWAHSHDLWFPSVARSWPTSATLGFWKLLWSGLLRRFLWEDVLLLAGKRNIRDFQECKNPHNFEAWDQVCKACFTNQIYKPDQKLSDRSQAWGQQKKALLSTADWFSGHQKKNTRHRKWNSHDLLELFKVWIYEICGVSLLFL